MATTATPGSDAPTAPEPRYVARFGVTERVLHWVHAVAFFGMLGSGLVLYLPSLAAVVANRPLAKAIHLAVAVGWLTALAVIPMVGDRNALRRTRQEIERFADDDLHWLRGSGAPQGRFNAGQKVHTVFQAALATLFTVSGVLLWVGVRNTSLKLPGTIALHDIATYIAVALVLGHLFLSLVWPTTRPALRGIVRGTVRADWARKHHARWRPVHGAAAPSSWRGRSVARAAVVTILGLALATFVVRDVLKENRAPQPATAAAAPGTPSADASPPAPPATNALALAAEAQQLDSAGRLPEAIALYQQAVAATPDRADFRGALGFALVRSGDLTAGTRELRAGLALQPRSAQMHLLLGATLLQGGNRPAGRRELRRSLQLAPNGPGALAARRLLRSPPLDG